MKLSPASITKATGKKDMVRVSTVDELWLEKGFLDVRLLPLGGVPAFLRMSLAEKPQHRVSIVLPFFLCELWMMSFSLLKRRGESLS